MAKKAPKPTTAYDLCMLVAQHIEEEPLRYLQSNWWLRAKELARAVAYSKLPAEPPCGTAACRAGWIVGLHDGIGGARLAMRPEIGIGHRARQILGVKPISTNQLFDGFAVYGAPGTPEYAKAGADGLRRWARRRAKHLKARLLKDVPKLRKH